MHAPFWVFLVLVLFSANQPAVEIQWNWKGLIYFCSQLREVVLYLAKFGAEQTAEQRILDSLKIKWLGDHYNLQTFCPQNAFNNLPEQWCQKKGSGRHGCRSYPVAAISQLIVQFNALVLVMRKGRCLLNFTWRQILGHTEVLRTICNCCLAQLAFIFVSLFGWVGSMIRVLADFGALFHTIIDHVHTYKVYKGVSELNVQQVFSLVWSTCDS